CRDYPALILARKSNNDEENGVASQFHGLPPFLSIVETFIELFDASRILECFDRCVEIDAVLAPGSGLPSPCSIHSASSDRVRDTGSPVKCARRNGCYILTG